MKKKISINTVLYRDASLKSIGVNPSITCTYESAVDAIRDNRIIYEYIDPYFKDNMNSTIANQNIEATLYLLAKLSESKCDDAKYDFYITEFTNYILPYIKNLNKVKNNPVLDRIKDNEKILEAVQDLEQSDRLLSNFTKINKKYNILESVASSIPFSDMRTILENIYDCIDQYKIPKGPKFNLALESAIFIFCKLGYNYDEKELVSEMTDIVASKSFNEKDLNSYKGIARNNVFFDEFVSYLFESEDFADSNDVEDLIKKYKKSTLKNEGLLKRTITKIYARSPKNLIDETPNILEFIRNCGILGTLAIHPVLTLVVFCVDKFIEMSVKEAETKKILKYFESEKNKVDKKIKNTKNDTQKERLEKYSKCLDQCIDKIKDYKEAISADENIKDVLDDIDEAANTPDMLRNTSDQYLVDRYNVAVSELKTAIQLLSNVLYLSEFKVEMYDDSTDELKFADPNNLNKFITPNGFIQVPICNVSCDYMENNYLYKHISKICSDINMQLNNYILLAYNCGTNVFIIFMDLYPLDIKIDNFDEAGMYQALNILENIDLAIESMKYNPDDLLDKISDKLYSGIDEDTSMTLSKLGNQIIKYANESHINNFMNAMRSSSVSVGTIWEATTIINNNLGDREDIDSVQDLVDFNEYCIMISALLEDSNKTKEVKEKIEKKEKEINKRIDNNKKKLNNKKKSFSKGVKDKKEALSNSMGRMMNNGALAMQAMKKGIQDLSDKEKQASRTLDITFSSFQKAIERSLTSDRREAIIKGSIIPSFSKMIKTGIVFAGTAAFVSPVIAVIGAIGSFALSKSLTNKERQLLLDEIEVELKAVEKEIAMAEDNRDMKRYRQLSTYQRKLEREYQRIRYNVKVYAKDVNSVVKYEK